MNKRRSILVALGGLTVLPTTWKTPIVNSVMLPAHASTSSCSGTIQLFADGFGSEITGNPPEVTIGTTYNFLITTDCPNTEIFYATYQNNTRVGDVQSLVTDNTGVAALAATPQSPAGTEVLMLAETAAFLILGQPEILTPEAAFITALFFLKT